MIPKLRLPCGAALVAETAEEARSFALGFWFPIGSRHEAPQERGFVHFVEHMLFKGTQRRGAASISREIDRVGGYLNAFTDRDSICVHCQVPASQWRVAIDLLADMTMNSIFRLEDFEREREVIVSEIVSAEDDPEECSHDAFVSAIWPNDPLSRKIAGEARDIRRVERDVLYAFYKREFSPHNLLITASGPKRADEIGDALSSLMDASLESAPAPREVSAPRFLPARCYLRADMEQVHFFEAVQLEPPFSERDYFALSALNGAIGEASSSRLFIALREDRGLCYSVYSGFGMSRTECLWLASATVSPAQLPRLADEMDRQLDELAARGLTEQECGDALARLSGAFELSLEDTDFRMRRLARQLLFSGGADSVQETRARIASLSADDLNIACRRLLSGVERARFAYGGLSRRMAKANGLAQAARRG